MPAKQTSSTSRKRRRKPATTIEGRENQLIADAIDMAEEQIANRTASSQVLTHYLKLGSTRERLEQLRLEHENELTQAKIEHIRSAERTEELYQDALRAMGRYSGKVSAVDDEIRE